MSTNTAKILAFAGSIREGSFNRKLIKAAAMAATDRGIAITLVELSDYQLPLYNQDLEKAEGLPGSAKKLKALFAEHQGLLISSPEYNSSLSPLLKNTLDWVSRKESPSESELSSYKGKAAAIISASPGALGGLRGLNHLRDILGNIGVTVVPAQLAISAASDAFTEDGKLKDEKKAASLVKVIESLAQLTKALT